MRERLLHSMAASKAQEAGSAKEPVLEPQSNPDSAKFPGCYVLSPSGRDSCNGAFAEHSPLLEQSDKRALQKGSDACRPPVRWLSRGATVLLLLTLLLLAFNRPTWRGRALFFGALPRSVSQSFKDICLCHMCIAKL